MKTRNIFIIIIISLFLTYSIKFLNFTHTSNFNNLIFLIKYEYYGIDSQQIEQLITIPLEQELYTLENVIEIKSTSQLNQSITTITFNSYAKYDSTYLAIRKITEHFSNSLPDEVQPCKILISHTENSNIICTSFNCSKRDLEKYKQEFENIQGVSEVIINGREDNSIIIEFSNLELANLKLTTSDIKRAIQNNNQNNIAVRQITSNSITRLSFNNKIKDIDDFANINIITDDRIIPLNKITKIYYEKSHESDIYLINNTEVSILNLKMDSDANLISVSNNLKKILYKTNLASFEPVIIYDSGNEQFQKLIVVSLLILISLICSCLITYILFRSFNFCLFIISIFTICIIWTLGILSLVHVSITIEILITFIIIPIVYLIHPSFYIINSISSRKNAYTFIVTTFVISSLIYFPPILLKNKLNSLFSINLSLIISLISLIILTILFEPIFFKSKSKIFLTSDIFKKIRYIFNFKKIVLLSIISFCISLFILFSINKRNFHTTTNNNISLQLDFNIERTAPSIQNELAPFLEHLQKIDNIKFVKTEISRGTCSIEIIPNKNKKRSIYDEIQNLLNSYGKINAYLKDINYNKSIRLIIKGGNIQTCESYAIQIADLLKSEKEVKQVILNFKDHEKQYFFIPDLLNLCKHNTTVNELSSILRDFVYNPVITKVFMNYKETDVRLYPDHPYTISQILESNFIIMDNSLINLKDLGIIEIKYIPSKIHRLNGNRCAYLTLQMNSLNHKIKNKIAKKLSQLRLEEGYTITSENTEEQLTQMFNITSLYLLISVAAIILILTALYENIRKTLVIVLCPFTLILLILIIVILFNFEMNYVLYEALLVILSIYTTILNEFYVD